MNASKLCSMVATAGVLLALPAMASATIIFSDDFDSDSPVTELNFDEFLNWGVEVDTGTVDYLRSGNIFGLDCHGIGGCVDLDGSTGDAGVLSSSLSFAAGNDYTLSFWYSGNQRSGVDNLTFGIKNGLTHLFVDTIFEIVPDQPFTLVSLSFSPTSDFDGQLFFSASGGDNIGPILDDVTLRVPEPGSLGLLGLGLITLVLSRRRARY